MLYRPFVPQRSPLSDVVETVFYLEGYRPEHRLERIVPDGSINLVIELDGRVRHVCDRETKEPQQACVGSWLSGVHTSPLTIEALPDTRLVAVRMRPGRASWLLGPNVDAFTDRVTPGTEIFGPAIDELRESLVATTDADRLLARSTEWLESRCDAAGAPPDWLMQTVDALLAEPSVGTLTGLLEASGYSHKHFIHVFRRHVGVRPKQFQRIVRFQAVLGAIHEERDVRWAQVAAECGYSDQSHLIRDFARFSGYRPQRFRREGHERINFFPE